jgi:hypothetical protein
MLASIHPLGERGRRQRWGVTVAAYVAGTVLAATALGGVLGWTGGELRLPAPAMATGSVVALVSVVGLAFDLRVGGLSLPTVHRQVDEEWLDEYRGWVYGAGFGVQLGLGVVTVVNSFTVYLTLILAALSGSAAAGAAIGATFGAVRGVTILASADVRDPDRLRRLHRRLAAWGPASKGLAVGVQGLVAVGGLAAVVAR